MIVDPNQVVAVW